MICSKCHQEIKEDFIVIDGWAYEIKEHDFDKKLSDIEIPNGKELWLPSECWKFYEDKKLREKLNLSDCWFFVKQVKDNTKDVARFFAYSDRANFYCDWVPTGANPCIGVFIIRKKSRGATK